MVTCFIKKVSHEETDVGDEVVRSNSKTQVTMICSNCAIQKDRDSFSKTQWLAACRGLKGGKCKECTKVGELIMCCVCNEKKARSKFSKNQKKKNDPSCKECKNSVEQQRQRNKADALKQKAETLKIKAEELQNKAEAAMAKYDRKRSRDADTTNLTTKKPRLHTSQGEKAATMGSAVDIGVPKKAVPDRISSGVVSDVAPSLTASDMTGMDNRLSWMASGQDSRATAFSEQTSIRGLGRCIDNRPAWMMQGSGDRLPKQAMAFSVQEERRDHDRMRFANIDMPTEIPQINAAQTAAKAVFNSRGRGVDNRPAWMTRSQSLCHT
jgi:hypothetical protein